MRIDQTKYEKAYRCGQQVHAGTMRITDAKKQLEAIGINPNSSADLAYGVKHLLNGHRFTRTLSAPVLDDYLSWILRDYGIASLKNAVSALGQHIDYYQSLTKSPMREKVEILRKHAAFLPEDSGDFVSPEEIDQPDEDLFEGQIKTVSVNVYERNPKARSQCIDHHGCACSVCGFDFKTKFGAIGKGFIHVHHIRDLASIGKSYKINPVEDLRPVCPNCHAMLHKSKPAYIIDELRQLILAQ